jgi:flagellar hook-associated protein 1 FlgK
MAGGINSVLSQAKSALAATQVAMNSTAKNVSNVNTEGYSRQRVDLKTGLPEQYGQHQLGGGVDVGAISRSTNKFVNQRLEQENSALGKFQGLTEVYSQLEMVFKEDGDGSISGAVSQFFNDIRTLSTQPDSIPLRTSVRESAKNVAGRFQTMSLAIDQVVTDVDQRLEGAVSDINRLTDRIAQLNRQISDIEVGKVSNANDERDQRDQAVLELSKLVDIKTTDLENGSINISVGSYGPIVMGVDRQELATFRSPSGDTPNSVRIYLLTPHNGVPPKDITEKFESGQVGGLLTLRDQTIPGFRNKVDSLAYNLADQVNSVHRAGFSRSGSNGISFFQEPSGIKGAAAGLDLSSEVSNDISNIAAGAAANAAGDNRTLLSLANLETAKIFNGGGSNFNDEAASILGSLGVQVRGANDSLATQQSVVEQLDTLKKTTSGVSLDEEAMNMLRFQKAFDASAKMIQVADQMMDTVINLKRF